MNNALIKKFMRHAWPYTFGILEQITVRQKTPILVYQMGKVGSSTIEQILSALKLDKPVFQVHFLSEEGIASAIEYYKQLGCGIPRHLSRSKFIKIKISSSRYHFWKVITLVREPIGRSISNVFQNMPDINPHFMKTDGTLKINDLNHYLENYFEGFDAAKDFTCSWMDKEIKQTFGTNVYAYPFDTNRGYSIIKENDVEILIIRMEDMNLVVKEALCRFLNITGRIQIFTANMAETKSYAKDYQNLKEQIIIPRHICQKIYQSKYVRHFYSDEMIENYIEKWS